jgi:hypothetical protein
MRLAEAELIDVAESISSGGGSILFGEGTFFFWMDTIFNKISCSARRDSIFKETYTRARSRAEPPQQIEKLI